MARSDPHKRMILDAWRLMTFIRTASKLQTTIDQPETRAAFAIAEASMLALLRELTRPQDGNRAEIDAGKP